MYIGPLFFFFFPNSFAKSLYFYNLFTISSSLFPDCHSTSVICGYRDLWHAKRLDLNLLLSFRFELKKFSHRLVGGCWDLIFLMGGFRLVETTVNEKV
jgi:hypothetical protein